jgi:ATP-binding cassette subfamily C protein
VISGAAQLRAAGRAIRHGAGALHHVAGNRSWALALLLAAGSILESVGLVMLIPILHVATALGGGRFERALVRALGTAGAVTPAAQLAVLLGGFVLVMLLRTIVLYARDMLIDDLQGDFVARQRSDLLGALARAPWSRIERVPRARILNLLGAESARSRAALNAVAQCAIALTSLVVLGLVAVALAPRMALAALAVGLLASAASMFDFARAGREAGIGIGRAGTYMTAIAANFLAGLKPAYAENARTAFLQEFDAIEAQMRADRRQRRRGRIRIGLGVGLLPAIAGAGLIWFGIVTLALPPALLIPIVVILGRMTQPLSRLNLSARQFLLNAPAIDAFSALADELGADAPPHPPRGIVPPGPIAFRDVGYRHAGGEGLSHISFVLPPGSFLGVTGASGAGKTTLVDLLVGILRPQQGSITAGGAPLDDAHLPAWRDSLAYVVQDAFLFHATVRANLMWGGLVADEDQMATALLVSGAAAVVAQLPQGLDTVIGEGGTPLSGGERQRLAIARALLRRPRLLILDEATNALDIAAEAALLQRLAALDPRPTIVMIAHRTESLAWCDQHIAIIGGRVVAGRKEDGATEPC